MIGPKCIDPMVCRGDCCNSSQEIPRILAEEYQKMHFLSENEVLRSQQQLFRLKINPNTHRCVFFNISQNKCSIYTSRLIPPQCSNYPISTEKYCNKCRKNFSFEIEEKGGHQLDELKKEYFNLTQQEFDKEFTLEAILARFNNRFIIKTKKCAPSEIFGVKDALNGMLPIISDNFSWNLIKICDVTEGCNQDYTTCSSICEECLQKLISILSEKIFQYVEKNHPRDEYFTHLFELIE